MRIVLVYVFPSVQPEKYVPAAKLFTESYLHHPPGTTGHDVSVWVTGTPADHWEKIFVPLPVTFFRYDNYAKDLGAFKKAAEEIDCDLLVCLGAHVNFKRAGWLDRIMLSLDKPTLCGPWGFQEPRPHLRTTFFCCPPSLITSYPHDLRQRYEFEHGRHNIAIWSREMGLEPMQITWSGNYTLENFHAIPLSESLARDQHTLRDFGE